MTGAIVSRKDFRTVVSHVVNVTYHHTNAPQRRWLVNVARNAEQVAYGDWKVDGVDCLALQAHMHRSYPETHLVSEQYDSAISDLLRDLRIDDSPQVLVIAD